MGRLALAAYALLLACVPFSGSAVPSDKTFLIPDSTVHAMLDPQCLPDWVSGDARADTQAAREFFAELGYKMVVRKRGKFNVTLRDKILLKKGFWELDELRIARTLAHEAVHACQRELMGHVAFVRTVASSLGRLEMEVPAYLQTFRTMQAQGFDRATTEGEIDAQLVKFRDQYLLHDIDEGQFFFEVRQVWIQALETP